MIKQDQSRPGGTPRNPLTLRVSGATVGDGDPPREHAPARVGPELRVGLAERTESWDGAFRLVHDQYVSRGYTAPHPSGWRLSLHHALPSTKVFVATAGPRVVGTVTLIEDSPLGLPMDEICREKLAELRSRDRRAAEVCALAIAPEYQRVGVVILLRLVRMLMLYAAEIVRLDDLCIVVNPRHVDFYQSFFCGQPVGGRAAYLRVGGAPAQALHLDLHCVRALIHLLQLEVPVAVAELIQFFYGPENCRRVTASLLRNLEGSNWTAEHFAHFLAGHGLLAAASPSERAYVTSLYESPRLAARGSEPWRSGRAAGLPPLSSLSGDGGSSHTADYARPRC